FGSSSVRLSSIFLMDDWPGWVATTTRLGANSIRLLTSSHLVLRLRSWFIESCCRNFHARAGSLHLFIWRAALSGLPGSMLLLRPTPGQRKNSRVFPFLPLPG